MTHPFAGLFVLGGELAKAWPEGDQRQAEGRAASYLGT